MGLTNHILSTEDIPPEKKKEKKKRKTHVMYSVLL
jgi:hypothetical protein